MLKNTRPLLLFPVLLLAACGPKENAPSVTPPPVPESLQVTLTGPSEVTTTTEQTWTATTSSNVKRVEFYLDGQAIGTDTEAPFEVTRSFAHTDNGGHTLKAVATTAQGTQASQDATFTVRIAAPVQPQPQPDPKPQPQPTVPLPFIPEVGAAVGTGDGTPVGTVRVSPNAQEVEFMHLLNEARTKGTMNGVDVRAGTCLEGIAPGTLKPLTYNGLAAYATRKHSVYLGTWGFEGHYELNPNHPNFYGYEANIRLLRAYKEFGLPEPGFTVFQGENVTASPREDDKASDALMRFLKSRGHCETLASDYITNFGVGFYSVPDAQYKNGPLTVYASNWTVYFSRPDDL